MSNWLIPLPSPTEFIAGACGGIGQIVSAHPIDTIKTRLQLSNDFKSPWDCVSKTIKNEGFFGLYRGMGAPIVGVAFVNAVVFTSFGWCKNLITNSTPTIPQVMLAGSGAGIANSFVAAPVELVKIRLQINRATGNVVGPFVVIKSALKEKGLRGLYRGLSATILKEIPAYAGCLF
jgi:solute carrier family 25 carnitine/acylcarnitine transporter 20/29